MIKLSNKITYQDIKQAINKLSPIQRIRLFEELERQTRKERWDQVVSQVRERAAQSSISQDEIDLICEEVRQQLYEKRTQGRH